MFPTSIGIELANERDHFTHRASTHDAHRTVESRPNVVVHAFDKVVVGLASLAAKY
jgi:hypothetical protein